MYIDYMDKVREVLSGKKYLVVSDDIDSYLTGCLVKKIIPDIEVVGFYDNKQGLYMNKNILDPAIRDKVVAVDTSFHKNIGVDCISNHCESINRTNYVCGVSVNERIDYPFQYTTKSMFSSLLFMWASMGVELPNTDVGKSIVLSVDGTANGLYVDNQAWQEQGIKYLELYGLSDMVELRKKYDQEYFSNIYQEYLLPYKHLSALYNGSGYDISFSSGEDGIDDVLSLLGLPKLDIPTMQRKLPVKSMVASYTFFSKLVGHNEYIVSYARVQDDVVLYSVIDMDKL